MAHSPVDTLLQRIVRLSHEMITLADAGDEIREDPGCGAVFGKLRDEGYALRAAASRELQTHQAGGARVSERRVVEAPRAPTKTVLVVDDDADIRRYLSTWFEDAGFRTLLATNGYEAIELATRERPDLISLDMSMPEKSGVSTYRDLKQDPALKAIPVIIITAIGRAFEEFLRGRRSVPDPEGFLPKPVNLDQLSVLVSDVLSRPATVG